MADIIRVTITFFLSNYSFTFFLIGLVVSLIAIMAWQGGITRALIVEKLLAWYVFFSIGVDNLYNFVMHVFFGEMSARFIGWADSPFQLEVGAASLGLQSWDFSRHSAASICVWRRSSVPAFSRWVRRSATFSR